MLDELTKLKKENELLRKKVELLETSICSSSCISDNVEEELKKIDKELMS